MRDFVTQLSSRLTPEECDALKLQLSLRAAACLDRRFQIRGDDEMATRFSSALSGVLATQPYRDRVPKYGIARRSRDLLSLEELARLRAEAVALRHLATLNFGQQALVHAEELPGSLAAALSTSRKIRDFVTVAAGPCEPTHVATYVYYDARDMRSDPHVDNIFSAITLMILLHHEHGQLPADRAPSTTVSYWPDSPRLDLEMTPGEALVFFGSATLHGRTPVAEGETVSSLLLSFQPR